MSGRDGQPAGLRPLYRRYDGTVGAAPAEHQQRALRLPQYRLLRDVVGDSLNLLLAVRHHAHVVLGVVADPAGGV